MHGQFVIGGCYLGSSHPYNGSFIHNSSVNLWIILLSALSAVLSHCCASDVHVSDCWFCGKNKHAKQVALQGPLILVRKSQIREAKETSGNKWKALNQMPGSYTQFHFWRAVICACNLCVCNVRIFICKNDMQLAGTLKTALHLFPPLYLFIVWVLIHPIVLPNSQSKLQLQNLCPFWAD